MCLGINYYYGPLPIWFSDLITTFLGRTVMCMIYFSLYDANYVIPTVVLGDPTKGFTSVRKLKIIGQHMTKVILSRLQVSCK